MTSTSPTLTSRSALGLGLLVCGSLLESMCALPGPIGPSLLPELIAVFRQDEANRPDELVVLAAGRDGPMLARAAHAFAGSCAVVGARELHATVMPVEQAALASEWSRLPALFTEMQAALNPATLTLGRRCGDHLTARVTRDVDIIIASGSICGASFRGNRYMIAPL